MRKFLISIIGVFMVFSVFAAGENIATSKSYVDSALVPKQDIIEGTNDAPQVLTNTGTAGEYGIKDIYDSTGAYSGQIDALVDAATMNTAVQNAINSEFQCVEYNPNDPTDCWLMDVRGATATRSPNLLDASFMDKSTYKTTYVYNDNGTVRARILPTENGKTYTLSVTLTYTGNYAYYLKYVSPDKTQGAIPECSLWAGDGSGSRNVSCTFTAKNNNIYLAYMPTPGSLSTLNLSNYQMEEGSTATPYQPYGNIYVPSEN